MTTHETSIPIHRVTAVHNLKIRAFDNIFMLSNTSSAAYRLSAARKKKMEFEKQFVIKSAAFSPGRKNTHSDYLI